MDKSTTYENKAVKEIIKEPTGEPTTEQSEMGSSLYHDNYMKLKEIADGILSNRYSYMKLKSSGYMDLCIEHIWGNRISMSHYYQQNGDLMADPDMELIVDHENETIRSAAFQQDNLGIYQMAYSGDDLIDQRLSKELDDFLSQWLDNIKNQGFIPYKAYYQDPVLADIEEVVFDDMGKELNQVIDDEKDQEVDHQEQEDIETDLETNIDEEEELEM